MKGLLLMNLGSTAAPTPTATGSYLKEFLMDPLVIDIPWLWRWILVHIIIVPRRKHKSAHAYQQVWLPEGSPLVVNSMKYKEKVRQSLEGQWTVQMAMRYGMPSIADALQIFREKKIEELFILPLYPQFADSSTRTALLKVQEELDRLNWKPAVIKSLSYFYDNPGFIRASVRLLEHAYNNYSPDHLLFSFHGLPERHLTLRRDLSAHCLKQENCCAKIGEQNKLCYRAQCFASTRYFIDSWSGPPPPYSVAFQSRLGRAQWIQPSIEEELERLAQSGVRRLLVACPSFVSDGLETLEEIQIRMKEYFLEHGGQDLRLVPSLNDSPDWVAALSEILSSEAWEEFPRCLDRLKG
jgi:ferrochelatase